MQILLPKLGFSMNEARLVEWLHADGARVEVGQPLYSLESDKAIEEIPAPCSGVLRVVAPAGETYTVGTVIGEITP